MKIYSLKFFFSSIFCLIILSDWIKSRKYIKLISIFFLLWQIFTMKEIIYISDSNYLSFEGIE